MDKYNLLQTEWNEFTNTTIQIGNDFRNTGYFTNVIQESNNSYDAVKNHFFYLSKNIFDFTFSFLLLILLSPILIISSLLIILIDRQSPLFSQVRIGQNAERFIIYKFRTMVDIDTKSPFGKLVKQLEDDGVVYKHEKDPRITKLGKFLRRTSIDELPQLINVLKGEMSLIGPRPLVPILLKDFPEILRARSLVKPGISGLWQVMARAQNQSVFSMMKWDFEYIRNFSFKQDLYIFFKTFWVVLTQEGAI